MSSSRSASRRSATTESLARRRLSYLLNKIASGEPAPASGSAAAAVVATAAALLQKVAIRTKSWPGAGAAHARAEALRLRAEELIELDSLAFLDFVAALRSGQDVEAARKRTIDVPKEIAGAAAAVVDLAHELELKGNPNLRADAVAASILAQAAGTTAAMLVQVNESPARRGAPGPAGGRGRAPARSPGSDRPSRPRTSRAVRSAGASPRSES
jgi:formiminotetrahydrofolate cyclodeaminase